MKKGALTAMWISVVFFIILSLGILFTNGISSMLLAWLCIGLGVAWGLFVKGKDRVTCIGSFLWGACLLWSFSQWWPLGVLFIVLSMAL